MPAVIGCTRADRERAIGSVSGYALPVVAVDSPAPWRCSMRAVVWPQAVPVAVRGGLSGPIGDHRWLPVGLGGLVVYRDTPVGPYGEVFAALATFDGTRPLGHVPFMAVDSTDSVAGGRSNWALPKELVRFDGDVVRGDGWAATISATTRRRTIPVAGGGRARQPWPDGALRDFLARFSGRAGIGAVTVAAVPGTPSPSALTPGTYPAVLLDGSIDVLAPQLVVTTPGG